MTLHPGDVILTGTPAGSSVIVPGDTVEVEVNVPASGLTTGRLSTPVTQGTTAMAAFGNQPRLTVADLIDAYGSEEAASAAGALSPAAGTETAGDEAAPASPAVVLTDELKAKLNAVATATISATLRKHGLNNVSIDGLQGTKSGRKVIGTARTLRLVPNREDLFKSHGGGASITISPTAELARGHRRPDGHVRKLILPTRTHANAETSRAYKRAAVEFIDN